MMEQTQTPWKLRGVKRTAPSPAMTPSRRVVMPKCLKQEEKANVDVAIRGKMTEQKIDICGRRIGKSCFFLDLQFKDYGRGTAPSSSRQDLQRRLCLLYGQGVLFSTRFQLQGQTVGTC